jgi:RNA recognition motif-containing protein
MNIYVGNLSFDTTEEDLRTAFGGYGTITSVAIIKDKFSGESRGFGFVEMANSAEAKKAIEGMGGTELNGRSLNVNEARPREERGPGGPGGGGDRNRGRTGGFGGGAGGAGGQRRGRY